MNNERENSMADGEAFLALSLASCSVRRNVRVQYRTLFRYMYTKILLSLSFFLFFLAHTISLFNAVVASCMQPKYRWIFIMLCCKHTNIYDAEKPHPLAIFRIGYDCNWIRSKSITSKKKFPRLSLSFGDESERELGRKSFRTQQQQVAAALPSSFP